MNENFYRNRWRQTVGVILVLVIILPSIFLSFPKKAEAQWVVWDPSVSIKDYLLDNIAWLIVNKIIERMSAETVNWINGGFQGSPAFITDPSSYFKNIGDQVAGQIIFNHPDLRFMCAPLRAKVQIALAKNYVQPYGNFQCTLSSVGTNFDSFMSNFYQGGWDGFVEISQRSQNNPLGLYNQAQNQINISVGSSLGEKKQELSWGNGFLSFKSCALYEEAQPGASIPAGQIQVGIEPYTDANGDPIPIYQNYDARKLPDTPPRCAKTVTNTPGSVIQTQLNKTLGIGSERLQVADEINEIISALLNQLVSKALGAVGSGLRSLSSPGQGGSSSSFTNQLNASNGRNITPMPQSGICPPGTSQISPTECATDVNQIGGQVVQSETGAASLINNQNKQVQALVTPQNTACYPLTTDPVTGLCIDCSLGTSLNSNDYLVCQNLGLVP